MKKILILFVVSVLFIANPFKSNAQAFQNGDMVANLGLGFGWYSYGYGVSSFPAISLSLEKGIKDIPSIPGGALSVGGIIGFKHASYSWSYSSDWSWTDYIIAARCALHADFLSNDKLDTYGGVGIGLRFQTEKYYVYPYGATNKVSDSNVHPLFAFYLGGRYYFTDNLAGFGELGYGLGYFTLGLSYKF